MRISIYNRQKALPICRRSARRLVEAILKLEQSTHTAAALYFVSPREIGRIHQIFFSDPTPTDTVSFPIDQENLGDVFVCPEIAIEYANKHGQDPYEEVALYAVHGLLHCLGYDDQNAADRTIMRKKEKTCMAHLKKLEVDLKL